MSILQNVSLPKKTMINHSCLFWGCLNPHNHRSIQDWYTIYILICIDYQWSQWYSVQHISNHRSYSLSWEYIGIPISFDGWPTLTDKNKAFSVVYSNMHVLGNCECRDGSKHVITIFRGINIHQPAIYIFLAVYCRRHGDSWDMLGLGCPIFGP